jgi:ABC-type transport system involved in multi-copper enzyme maturation permease subunit
VIAIIGYGLRESLRRRMFAVVLVLTVLFLSLYAYGTHAAFKDTHNFVGPGNEGLNSDHLAGAIVFGLSMFATLFLGTVLAVFLTQNVVRGDAEAGLLQPLVVRPIGRTQLLLARFAGAAGVCAVYVLGVYFAALAITWWAGDWVPDRIVAPGVELAAAAVVVASVALAGSVFLSPIANGVATLMIFGAGLVAGLLGEIGHAINSHKLEHIARLARWVLPFDALYEDALHRLTIDSFGFERFVLELGPFGGSSAAGRTMLVWAFVFLVGAAGVAALAFSRRDL